ncbi:MAG: aminoglycoside phosphotransferase [Pseudonocardiales bacterium]
MTDQERRRREWMEGHLRWAAGQFNVSFAGKVVHTSRYHSVGVRVRIGEDDAWLRVVYEDPEWGIGNYLESNVSANDIQGVPKPSVTRWKEWEDTGRRLRGELSTFVPDSTLSNSLVLTAELKLTDRWLARLRTVLNAIATHPLPHQGIDPDDLNHGLMAFFGVVVDFTAAAWTTAHSDFHWANITAPDLVVLDWETWGRAPAGYDAATLYCTSLLCPATAHRIHEALAYILDTSSGRIATLAATVRLLRFIDCGDYLPLAGPLRDHAHRVIREIFDTR